jgi:hypothetical protein
VLIGRNELGQTLHHVMEDVRGDETTDNSIISKGF